MLYLLHFFSVSSDESEAESRTENDDRGNIIKLKFVDESNIPNMSIGEPNIVTDTGKSIEVSENSVNDINNENRNKMTVLQKCKYRV